MIPCSPHALILRLIASTVFAIVFSGTVTAQTAKQAILPVKIHPPEATLYVGESLTFTATVGGDKNAGIRWSIQEPDGGRITEEGTYIAPRAIGIYHVVASRKTDPRAKSVATVTVAVHSDVPERR